jgi:glycosyltransferase involved in cell wall biosynthesis
MKVALLTPTFSWFSGIDRVVYDQARQLMARGDHVEIFVFASDMEPPGGVTLNLFGMPKALFWQRIYRLLLPFLFWNNSRLVDRLKGFDVIYSHQYPMNWLAYLAREKYGAKYIYYDYGVAPPEAFDTVIERLYMQVFTRFSNWTARKADSAVSISVYLKEQLKKDTGLVSEVIYPRIDTGRFHGGIDGSAIREKHKLADGPVVLYIGRISPHKGVHLLIRSFMEVRKEIPGARLLIAGKHTFAKYSSELQAISNDSIIFAGYVPDEDIPCYYAASDVYATATLWEGFNLPLAEAQACEKPVVAFDLGPHPEVVLNEQTGYLVARGDVHGMAAAILRLLNDPALRSDMGAKAAAFIREKFS